MTGEVAQDTGGLSDLRQAVLGSPVCCACGACAGLCPYVLCLEDRVAAIDECGRPEGRCYAFCPRTGRVEAGLSGDLGWNGPLGPYRAAAVGRGAWDRVSSGRHQYGGLVTALVVAALREGLVDAAVVTAEVGGLPCATTARTEAEVLAAAGSKFALSPTLREVNQALERGDGRLLVVALPCQAAALARMRRAEADRDPGGAEPGRSRAESIPLVIGLFCTWALTQRGWLDVVGDAAAQAQAQAKTAQATAPPAQSPRVLRADVPPPPARVMTLDLDAGDTVDVSLDRVKQEVRSACAYCTDLTAENADLSVGRLEESDDSNLLLVRSEIGERLVEAALALGLVELEPVSSPSLALLTEASCAKKERAAAEARSSGLELPFLRVLGRGDLCGPVSVR